MITSLTDSDKDYAIHNGDCIPHMLDDIPESSVDFSVFSPPFPALYAYTSSGSDIGNSECLKTEAKIHLSYFFAGLERVMKPGRAAIVHVMQIPRLKRLDRRGGMQDFRGLIIRLAERKGLIYEYDWAVRKNPQSQAIRTKSRELQFSGLEKDRSRQRGALPDYLIKFRKEGENAKPVNAAGEVSRNEWIDWAECCWMDIKETDTLNTREAKSDDDVKHICPLQLGVIDRLVRLYSDPGEIVFSPFAGIGSEGYQSLLRDRKFYGCELKKEYYETALKNCKKAVESRSHKSEDLFSKGI